MTIVLALIVFGIVDLILASALVALLLRESEPKPLVLTAVMLGVALLATLIVATAS